MSVQEVEFKIYDEKEPLTPDLEYVANINSLSPDVVPQFMERLSQNEQAIADFFNNVKLAIEKYRLAKLQITNSLETPADAESVARINLLIVKTKSKLDQKIPLGFRKFFRKVFTKSSQQENTTTEILKFQTELSKEISAILSIETILNNYAPAFARVDLLITKLKELLARYDSSGINFTNPYLEIISKKLETLIEFKQDLVDKMNRDASSKEDMLNLILKFIELVQILSSNLNNGPHIHGTHKFLSNKDSLVENGFFLNEFVRQSQQILDLIAALKHFKSHTSSPIPGLDMLLQSCDRESTYLVKYIEAAQKINDHLKEKNINNSRDLLYHQSSPEGLALILVHNEILSREAQYQRRRTTEFATSDLLKGNPNTERYQIYFHSTDVDKVPPVTNSKMGLAYSMGRNERDHRSVIVFSRSKIFRERPFFVGDGIAVFDPEYKTENPVPAKLSLTENHGIFIADKEIWPELLEEIKKECEISGLNFYTTLRRIMKYTIVVDFDKQSPYELENNQDMKNFIGIVWDKIEEVAPDFFNRIDDSIKVLSPTAQTADAWDSGTLALYRYVTSVDSRKIGEID